MDKERFKDRYYLTWHLTTTLGDLMSQVHLIHDDDIHTVIAVVKHVLSALEQERIQRNRNVMY